MDANGQEVMKCGFKIGGGIDQDYRQSPQGYADNVNNAAEALYFFLFLFKKKRNLTFRFSGNLRDGDQRGVPGREIRAPDPRQDPAMQRLRLHHGDAQEGRGLYQEERRPQHAHRAEGRHPELRSTKPKDRRRRRRSSMIQNEKPIRVSMSYLT